MPRLALWWCAAALTGCSGARDRAAEDTTAEVIELPADSTAAATSGLDTVRTVRVEGVRR